MALRTILKRGARPTTVVTSFVIGLALLATGCGLAEAPILDPKGPIALAERNILFRALAIMMIVAVPLIIDWSGIAEGAILNSRRLA
jgi:cytochrome o ubiquinol oxidase subunit II